MRLFRSRKGLAAVVAGAFVFAFGVSSQAAAAPIRVASIDALDVGNNVCDFGSNGLGTGTAFDPFQIGTAAGIAEINDCDQRTMTITGATVNLGGTVTYTTDGVHGAFGVGQSVTISGMDPADLNATYARVTAATDTTFTIASATAAGPFVSGGSVVTDQDFFELTGDIDLSSGDEVFNDTSEASITGVSGDGTTVTYTVDSTTGFEAGDSVVIKGHSVNDFNLGQVNIDTVPSATEITVSNSANASAGTGGTISRLGWSNFDVQGIVLEGNNHTISGLTVDDAGGEAGLFDSAFQSTFRNINFTGVDIDTTGRGGSADYVGALAGTIKGGVVSNINVEGSIIGTNQYTGLVVGYSEYGNYYSISAAGSISFAAITVTGNQDGNVRPSSAGGIVGYSAYESWVDLESSVDITGYTDSADGTYRVYGQEIGGLMGQNDYSGIRNASATGDMIGGLRVGGAVGYDDCCAYTVNATASGSVSVFSNSSWEASYAGGFYGEENCCSLREYITASGNVSAVATEDSTGTIYGVGGLMGIYDCCGSVRNVSSTGSVTATHNGEGRIQSIGGLLGSHTCCGDLSDSFSTGDVTVVNNSVTRQYTGEIGGLLGNHDCCGAITNSYSTGDVSVTVDTTTNYAEYVGGFAGAFWCCGAVSNTYSTGNVTINLGKDIGGHTGWSDYGMQFVDSHASGNVTVGFKGDTDPQYKAAVGGFIGRAYSSNELNRVYADGDVTVTTFTGSAQPVTAVGGLIGRADKPGHHTADSVVMRDVYYRGSISAPNHVGGLVGLSEPNVNVVAVNAYVAADVTATETNAVVDVVAPSYWTDSTETNFFDSTVGGTSDTVTGFNARTTAQMKTASTYTAKGWSFSGDSSPWRIASGTNDGYPYLVVPPLPSQAGGTDWTLVKTLKYSGSKVALTTAKKRALRQAATQLIADGCAKVQLRARTNGSNVEAVEKRAKRAHSFLVGVLENRGADVPVVSNIRVRPNLANRNTVQVFCGEE